MTRINTPADITYHFETLSPPVRYRPENEGWLNFHYPYCRKVQLPAMCSALVTHSKTHCMPSSLPCTPFRSNANNLRKNQNHKGNMNTGTQIFFFILMMFSIFLCKEKGSPDFVQTTYPEAQFLSHLIPSCKHTAEQHRMERPRIDPCSHPIFHNLNHL